MKKMSCFLCHANKTHIFICDKLRHFYCGDCHFKIRCFCLECEASPTQNAHILENMVISIFDKQIKLIGEDLIEKPKEKEEKYKYKPFIKTIKLTKIHRKWHKKKWHRKRRFITNKGG